MNYTGSVISGAGRGRKMKVPTINLLVPQPFPFEHGIYAGWVTIAESRYMGAFHFGPRPVFNDEDATLEVHIIGAKIEAPEAVSFELVKRIRDIQNFESVDELKKRIKEDIEQIKKILHAEDR